jgi:hypothetical protein
VSAARLTGTPFATVAAQAAALPTVGDRSPVVGRLYYNARRYGYAIRYQVTPEAVELDHGARFVPGE